MRHVTSIPSPAYIFVGANTHQAPKDMAPAAYEVLLTMSASQAIINNWGLALRSVTDEKVAKKLQEFGQKGDVVYTSQLREDGIAVLSFYAGPERK